MELSAFGRSGTDGTACTAGRTDQLGREELGPTKLLILELDGLGKLVRTDLGPYNNGGVGLKEMVEGFKRNKDSYVRRGFGSGLPLKEEAALLSTVGGCMVMVQ